MLMRWTLVICFVFATSTLWTSLQLSAETSGKREVDGSSNALRRSVTDGPVEMIVEVSRAQRMVAEPFDVTIQVEAPASYHVTMPLANSDHADLNPRSLPRLGPFNLIAIESAKRLPIDLSDTDLSDTDLSDTDLSDTDLSDTDQSQTRDGSDTRRRWVTTLRLEAIAAGKLQIPSLESVFRISQTSTGGVLAQRTIRSPPIPIHIRSVLNEGEVPTAFRDIKGVEAIFHESATTMRWWLLAVIPLAVVAFVFFRRSTVSPSQLANAEIDRIESLFGNSMSSTIQIYAELSTTLRRYFELQLGISASSMSPHELTSALSRQGIAESTIDDVNRFMTAADKIKFAGQSPLNPSHDCSPCDTVRTIIRDTCDSNGREAS